MNVNTAQLAPVHVHVNIIDLVCAAGDEETCRRFPSREALAQYTRDEEKAYPLEWAKENPLLRQFLVHVYNPPKRQPGATTFVASLNRAVTYCSSRYPWTPTFTNLGCSLFCSRYVILGRSTPASHRDIHLPRRQANSKSQDKCASMSLLAQW